MPYKLPPFMFSPGNGSTRRGIREKLDELLSDGEIGHKRIENIYRKAFPDKLLPSSAEEMISQIMADKQGMFPELLKEVRTPE
jgi:Ca2+-binding EF-hand superfamily protein